MKALHIGRAAIVSALVLSLVAFAAPAAAQTGQLKGKVVDAQNKPLDDAKITMLAVATNRKFETRSNGKGEWMQIGLPPGNYSVTAEKNGLTQTFEVKLGLESRQRKKPSGSKGSRPPSHWVRSSPTPASSMKRSSSSTK